MLEVLKITLENAMDLVLAHKKASRLGERLNLTISTYSAFSTAVAEICREVIDRTDTGILSLGLHKEDLRYSLSAKIRYDNSITVIPSDPGFQNARKLLPLVDQYTENNFEVIELKIGLPRSNKISAEKISDLRRQFQDEPPYTAYEALKIKNLKLHEEAEEKEEELQLSKYNNEQKNEFISIASHELKTPVTIIKAYAQMALGAGETHCSPTVRNHLTRIEAQSTRLTTLIQQLMDVTKIESGKMDYKMEDVDLNTFLNDSISQVRLTVPEHKLKVDLKVSRKVKLDRLRMEQVLSNLVSNAAKYSAAGSLITIDSAIEESAVVVSINDEGIGMSEDEVEQIFEKFYRNQNVVNKYSGLGMGLYISSKIIKEHKGDIWVKSTKGVGSSFYVSLPVSVES